MVINLNRMFTFPSVIRMSKACSRLGRKYVLFFAPSADLIMNALNTIKPLLCLLFETFVVYTYILLVRDSFLESPGNFSGLKPYPKIEKRDPWWNLH